MDEKNKGGEKMQDILSEVWREWKVVRELGRGSYGVVYEAVRREYDMESRAAVKVITIPGRYPACTITRRRKQTMRCRL